MCEQSKRISAGAWVVFWPGQTLVMCDSCFLRGQRIADAMGFTLRGEKLPGEPLPTLKLDEDGRPFLEIE